MYAGKKDRRTNREDTFFFNETGCLQRNFLLDLHIGAPIRMQRNLIFILNIILGEIVCVALVTQSRATLLGRVVRRKRGGGTRKEE